MVRREENKEGNVEKKNREWWEKPEKEKPWGEERCEFLVFLRLFFIFPIFMRYMYIIGYKFGI